MIRKIKGMMRTIESQKQGEENIKEKLEMLNEYIGSPEESKLRNCIQC